MSAEDDASQFLSWCYHQLDPATREDLKQRYAAETGRSVPGERHVRPITAGREGMRINFQEFETRLLHEQLCKVYDTNEALAFLLQKIGIYRADIAYSATLRDTWVFVLLDLDRRMKVDDLIKAIR